MKHHTHLPHKHFLTVKEFLGFFTLFIILLVVAFPKYLLLSVLKNDNSAVTIKYLENLTKIYPNNHQLFTFLVKKYIKLGEYDKAAHILDKVEPPYLRKYYAYLIVKSLYFEKRATIFDVKKALINLAAIVPKHKELANFLYKEAISFGFYDLAFVGVRYTNNKKAFINLAIYLKHYDLALKALKEMLDKEYNEDYFIKYVDIALYTKKYNLAYQMVKKYYIFAMSEKAYEKILLVGLHFKDKELVDYSYTNVTNKDLLLQAYLMLKEYKKALQIAKEKNDTHLIAQIYLWSGDYKRAYKYFMKDGYEKNKKIIYTLATLLHKNKTLIQIAKERVLKGDYSQISLLTNAFIEKLAFKEAERFYLRLYRKRRKDIFLNELFRLYYMLGETKKATRIAWKFKRLSLDKAMWVSDIYISEKKYKKAYELLKRVKSYKYGYYQRMYFLAKELGYKKAQERYLIAMNKKKRSADIVLSLFYLYKQESLKKAFEFLVRNYYCNKALLYALLDSAYKLKKYRFITRLNPSIKPDFYYQFLINSYKKLGEYENAKRAYLAAIKRFPAMKKEFFWFLIANKDKDIKNYILEIKDKHLLLAAYMLLGNKKYALRVVKYLLKREKDNIDLWMQYFYLTNRENEKFYIYKVVDRLVSKNRKLLLRGDILEFYFYLSLKYQPSYKIERLLGFIKKHHLGYKKYLALYLDYFHHYEKIEYLFKDEL